MKKILFSLLAVATLIGCGKNDDNGSDSANYLVKKITTKDEDGNLEEVMTLTYQGGRPVSFSEANYENGVQTGTTQVTTLYYEGRFIKQAKRVNAGRDNYVQNFTYENGKVATKTEKYERNNYTTTYQYSYAGDQLTNVLKSRPTIIYVNGNVQSGTYYEERQFTYRGNTVIEVTTRYEKDLNGAVVTDTSYSYGTDTTTYTLSGGNVVKEVEENSYSNSVEEYTYDTKPNPLHYMGDLVEPNPTRFLDVLNGKNNILTYKNTYEHKTVGTKDETLISFEYTYNADGYPTVIKQYKKEGNGTREFRGTKEYEY
ncbi:wall associated protein [Capnocytophaga endodontalis]|uniref:Wall associated protein n=1 Tax=Capnocytophaga endodontalis TaxID=2708117 RepID=A0A1Z4BKC9_9FLAO|nr:wall associated protein [Capnocytophaga endodontalis]ASF41712.1 wall associated protein [Capnocytophaga endodontalis]